MTFAMNIGLGANGDEQYITEIITLNSATVLVSWRGIARCMAGVCKMPYRGGGG